jgi:hypothetical protein
MNSSALKNSDLHLEDILMDDPPEDEKKQSFVVDSIEKAAWAARKYIEAEDRVEERFKQNADFKGKIDLWSDRANKEDISTLQFMKSILEPYARQIIYSQKRGKSLKLPGAKVLFRTSPETVEVTNEDMAISFCEANHPKAVESKKILLKQELKKLLSQGNVIPGVKLVPGHEHMFIKDMEETNHESS